MGYELLGALFFGVLTPLVIVGFVVFWMMTHRERLVIEDNWERFASNRDREYVPARGEWPNRSSPSIRWQNEDLRFELSVIGLEAGARTRLAVWPQERLLGSFTVGPRESREGDTGGIDDAFFLAAFVVSSQPDTLARRVLDDPSRRAILGFWQRDDVKLAYRGGKVLLEWPGRESNAARIDEAERVARVLAHRVDDAFRHGFVTKALNASA